MAPANRLYRADCKIVLEQLKAEGIKVNLIYLDPPFNSNRTYSMIFNHGGVTAQQKSYHDMWDFTESTRRLVLDFRDELDKWDLPDAFKEFMKAWLRILEGGTAADRKLLNYLMYMTQRLIRLCDILSSTGTIYFHCDPTASHYLKIIMDGIFGRTNYRNEIIWSYSGPGRPPARDFRRKHDVIFRYSMSAQYIGIRDGLAPRRKLSSDELEKYSRTPDGRYYYDLPRGDYTDDSISKLDEDGRIRWTKTGNPRVMFFLETRRDGVYRAKHLPDVWTDIVSLGHAGGKKKRGYATEKPLPLLERILLTSTQKGDLVLDPFCGCGTTIEAAHRLGRRWIGVDISGDAVDEIKDRLAEISVHQSQGHYEVLEGNPDTMAEYTRLNPFEKQEWLVRRLGGLPNPKKSDDRGVDGDMTFHMGANKDGNDTWGRMIFSVKTGKQRSPAHVRELRGTMKNEKAQMGVLVLDGDPTPGIESAAAKAGQFRYQPIAEMPPKDYDKVQIITAYEIIENARVDCPPTMQAVKRFRKAQQELEV